MFLSAFCELGSITAAAATAEIGRENHYKWKKEDPEYLQAYRQAIERAGDALEDEAVRRAQVGVDEYVVSGGSVVIWDGKPVMKRRYSDSVLITLLKAWKRDKYSEKQEVVAAVKVLQGVDLSGLTEEELDALDALLAKTRIEAAEVEDE